MTFVFDKTQRHYGQMLPHRITRTAVAAIFCLALTSVAQADSEIFLGQGTMSGEVTASSVLLQTRLTATTDLDSQDDIPGAAGVACFQWSRFPDFRDSTQTAFVSATADHDYVIRQKLTDLDPGTKYFYRVIYAKDNQQPAKGPVCSFKTLPGKDSDRPTRFIVGSCMNYNKFMFGAEGRAGKVITATAEDKRLGFPAFAAMKQIDADFFIGTGDIVYYDNVLNQATTVSQLRQCWHEQFRFPRMIDFFRDVPSYWSKDDHDFRFNDSDNASNRPPSPATGIELFREQMPITEIADTTSPTYRTYRVNKHLQVWLTEGRDYRSPNSMSDGPDKTLWGIQQLQWIKSTLKASDAKWKILVTPTPMVGPDMAKKSDNHTSLKGFRHESDAFFRWLTQEGIKNFMTICGDRHWQYHSIHPSGIEEFACGALNDENSRLGIEPGDPKGTDPDALVKQPFISPEPSGGFISVEASANLTVRFHDDHGKLLYEAKR